MEPSKYVKKLIRLNGLDVHKEEDKAKVQNQVLKKYRNFKTINKILYKHLNQPGTSAGVAASSHGPASIPKKVTPYEHRFSRANSRAVGGGSTMSLMSITRHLKPHPSKLELPVSAATTDAELIKKNYYDSMKLASQQSSRMRFCPTSPPSIILLPFYEQAADVRMNAYVKFPKRKIGMPATPMKGHGRPSVPDWCIQLPDSYVRYVQEIKIILAKIKVTHDIFKHLDLLADIIQNKLFLTMITKKEICNVLTRIPEAVGNESGVSFSHFMFALGNPKLALKKKILQVCPRKLDCECEEEVFELTSIRAMNEISQSEMHLPTMKNTSQDKSVIVSGSNTMISKDIEVQKNETGLQIIPINAKEKEKAEKRLREQVFYSGLLIIQMFETLDNLRELLDQQWIPPSKIRIDTLGSGNSKKNPMASPYLSPRSLCVPRLQIYLPNEEDKNTKSIKTSVKYMHYTVHGPPIDNLSGGSVKLTENRERINEALRYLASKGDCLAMLPNFHCLLHFGDANADRIQEIIPAPIKTMDDFVELKPLKPIHSKSKTKFEETQDMVWINEESKKQYFQPTIPKRLTKLKGLVPLTYGRILRNRVKSVQKSQWLDFEKNRTKYRKELWKRLDVLNVPSGRLRDNFVYAFVSLMPDSPHLTTVHNKNPLHF